MDYSLLNKIGFCESVDNVNSLKQINKWMKKKAVVPCSRMLIKKKKAGTAELGNQIFLK